MLQIAAAEAETTLLRTYDAGVKKINYGTKNKYAGAAMVGLHDVG